VLEEFPLELLAVGGDTSRRTRSTNAGVPGKNGNAVAPDIPGSGQMIPAVLQAVGQNTALSSV
jgi:hypothetical protein